MNLVRSSNPNLTVIVPIGRHSFSVDFRNNRETNVFRSVEIVHRTQQGCQAGKPWLKILVRKSLPEWVYNFARRRTVYRGFLFFLL